MVCLLVFILSLQKERSVSVTFPSNFGASGFLNTKLKTERPFIIDLSPFKKKKGGEEKAALICPLTLLRVDFAAAGQQKKPACAPRPQQEDPWRPPKLGFQPRAAPRRAGGPPVPSPRWVAGPRSPPGSAAARNGSCQGADGSCPSCSGKRSISPLCSSPQGAAGGKPAWARQRCKPEFVLTRRIQ